ncbi:hypothetical protein [Falsiroseomonas oryzae]|uniref:hypothetical protein n=1 Tax=Falsiroseomonas oryzae TaxID=2766473 RepID=UPI0022EA3471|nr:hypothetical protein [Roseomonas sp. MO-31]
MPTATKSRRHLLAAALLALAAAPVAAHPGHDHGPQHRPSTPAGAPTLPPALEEVRAALDKYQDPLVAVRDGYASTVGCVAYANGAMGVHFLNVQNIGPTPDPFRPPLLVYEPAGGGRLRLVAAEWFVPLATGITERPTLFGRPFDGPMAGHEPLMPTELHHYDLHVWLWKENPAGLFNATNPNVGCAGHPYALMEAPTDLPAATAHRH